MATIRKVTYLNPETDQDILDWLSQQRNDAGAIRQVLRAYVADLGAPQDQPPVTFDLAGLQAMLEAALGSATLRQVVEAAVTTALRQVALVHPGAVAGDDEEPGDDLTDSFLID